MFDRLFKTVDTRLAAMGASVLISFIMLLGKVGAYLLTDSTAIFSDAAESIVHLMATSIAGFSLWYSLQPPDEGHPYGHGKIAYFSTALEGILIFAAAASVIFTAAEALVYGHQVRELGVGLGILGLLTLINLGLGLGLIKIGRSYNAVVLEANGRHVLTDMWTSLGVIVGVALVWLTGVTWLDPVVALLVGGNIIWTAGKLLRQAYHGLMERVDEQDTERIVEFLDRAIEARRITGYHQLRHRRVNDQIFVEVHLMFPSGLSVEEAHRRASTVEGQIKDLFPAVESYITTHLEPEDHEAAHPEGHIEPEDPLPSMFRSGK